MIRMCIVSTVSSTIQAFFGEQLRFLQDHGFKITIIASLKEGLEPFHEGFPKGVEVKYVKMSRTIKPLEDIRAFFEIAKIIRKGDFDIIQYVSPKASLFASIAAWISKVPVRLLLLWGLYYVTLNGLSRVFHKNITKLMFRLSTHVVSDSRGNCVLAVEEGLCSADKIGVVGHGSANGVDLNRFDPDRLAIFREEIRGKHNIPQDAFVFGTVANIVRDKGINELIESFRVISEQYPNVYLLGIGEIPGKNPVEPVTLEMIKNHKRIVYLGKQKEVEKYFTAMDVFVLPTYREGFGVVNIEASAMRLPVISTDVPGPQESIVKGETGILVPAKQVEPLIEAMKDLMGRPLYIKKLGEAGRKRVQEFYEQKKLWQAIVEHRKKLLFGTGLYAEENGILYRKTNLPKTP